MIRKKYIYKTKNKPNEWYDCASMFVPLDRWQTDSTSTSRRALFARELHSTLQQNVRTQWVRQSEINGILLENEITSVQDSELRSCACWPRRQKNSKMLPRSKTHTSICSCRILFSAANRVLLFTVDVEDVTIEVEVDVTADGSLSSTFFLRPDDGVCVDK